jgi:transposase-like protein
VNLYQNVLAHVNTPACYKKDILEKYFSKKEGAHFWLSVMDDLHAARDIEDILIVISIVLMV